VEENEFAPWSPEDDDELRTFLNKSVQALGDRHRRVANLA
jgi:hypothetical protein